MSSHTHNPSRDVETPPGATYGTPLAHGGAPAHLARAGVPMVAYGTAHGIGGSRPTAPTTNSFDIMGLLKALRRRWVRGLMLGLILGGVVGGIAWNVVPPAKYTASAALQVHQQKPMIVFPTKEQNPDFQVFQQTQIAWLTSTEVLKGALRLPQIARLESLRELPDTTDQVEWLRTQLRIDSKANSEIFVISMSGERPTDLAAIVNAVIGAYMENVVDREKRDRQDRLEKLRKLWDTYLSTLKTKQAGLRSLAEHAGAGDKDTLTFMLQSTIENLNRLKQDRATLQSDIRRLALTIQVGDAMKGDPALGKPEEPTVEISETDMKYEIDRDPVMRDLKNKEASASARIRRMAGTVRSKGDPAYQQAQRELMGIRAEMGEAEEHLRKTVQSRVVRGTTGEDLGSGRLAAAKTQLKVMQEWLEGLDKEIADLQRLAKDQNSKQIDVGREQEEILLAQETSRKVGTEVESLEVELQAPERVQIVNRAEPPRKKDDLKRLRTIGMAAAGAFALALFAVGFLEFRARRICSVDEVVNNLGLNIVGSLPAMPDRARRKLGGTTSQSIEERWQRLLVESVDAMRTMIIHAARVESLQLVMVTSAGQGEGKTSLAGHLATSLARAGRRTLLVDCDLRRPTVHRLFDEPIDPGLCESLRGELSPMDVVRQGPTPELSVVTAGRADELAQQILGQDRVREIFAEWKRNFEFVVIDTPPVLPVADSLFLSQHVDGVLFAILRDVSRVPQVQAAYDRLTRLGVRMLGAVVNGAQVDSYSYGSSYYNAPTIDAE